MHSGSAVSRDPGGASLLLLADPLLASGLALQLSSGRRPFQVALTPEALAAAPALVLWCLAGPMPFSSLERELHLLRERWQPAPLLLVLTAPSIAEGQEATLLRLPVEGLLLAPDQERLAAAIETLLAGGRLHDLPRAVPEDHAVRPSADGWASWLLQSGLDQIEAELSLCLAIHQRSRLPWPQQQLLQGRIRELRAARGFLLWLWGPLAMAWPAAESPSASASASEALTAPAPGPLISLRSRTAQGIWEAIHLRLEQAIHAGLANGTGQLLALEGLALERRRALLQSLLLQLALLLQRFRLEEPRGEALLERWRSAQPELRRQAIRQLAGSYVQLPQAGGLMPVADTLLQRCDLDQEDPELPDPLPLLTALVLAQPVLVDGCLVPPDEPRAVLQLEVLVANWLLRNAELLSAELLGCCGPWPELRRYLLTPHLLATRPLERLRNQLNAQQRWSGWFLRPVQLYESRRELYVLEGGVITVQALTEPRDQELARLSWFAQLVTLVLETRDALGPQVRLILKGFGDLLVVVLTQVIGRAIGLVGRGVLQGMGRGLSRG